jgi:hypothetical protein
LDFYYRYYQNIGFNKAGNKPGFHYNYKRCETTQSNYIFKCHLSKNKIFAKCILIDVKKVSAKKKKVVDIVLFHMDNQENTKVVLVHICWWK